MTCFFNYEKLYFYFYFFSVFFLLKLEFYSEIIFFKKDLNYFISDVSIASLDYFSV